MSSKFADRIARVQPSAIRELLKYGDDPSITSFGGGYPDAALFPAAELQQIYTEILSKESATALQYTASAGLPGLRGQIAERMSSAGSATDADDVLILQGAQQGLDLVAKLLINPGDVIVTENPTFLGALIAFNPCQPEYAAVDMDSEGMDVDALETTLATTENIKFIYVIPDFQNPTGVSLSLERRKRIIELANEYDVLVLEDSPYRELRFEGEALPTLTSLDTEHRVIHLGSFSKILAPGVRLGWVSAAPEILDKLGLLKLAADTQSSTLNMTAVTRFLDTFDIDAHVSAMRGVYRAKRDLMVSTMTEHFPAEVTVTRPEGGLFTWVTFPEGFDATAFMAEHALPEARVAYVPGGSFFPTEQRSNYARFSYSGQSDDEMVDALTRLGTILNEHI
ncbi:aminotransferase-like domain-containing protein [Brevibacterium sp. UCMA 11752]|uniref:aminotransferase-like domain-containing protein n=1 Tax=Brevibacterium sp. UCMA 11752 TaxID=2745946 RepID=UPI001F2EB92E|nr:PLP-dependent aminotransferase family protein [Brevibacterium sp. UCMA 11752]MCF2589329.1 PLP-dependent aminotransferase family protein [Brevibacterium sp. UCMA 11752]